MKRNRLSVNNSFAVYWCTFAICFFILWLRGWTRLVYPELYGEDAAIFLPEALSLGFRSLLEPYAGSYHTIQRLISLAVVYLLPVGGWALAVNLICYAIAAGVAAAIVRPGHAWIIPLREARIGVALMLCFVPGLDEMLGNLCNLNWMFLLWMALLAFRNPSQATSRIELGISVLVVFSVGTVILLVPLFAWRVWSTFNSSQQGGKRFSEIILFVLCLLTPVWLVFLKIHETYGAAMPGAGSGQSAAAKIFPDQFLAQGPMLLLEHFYRLVIYTPWLGMANQSHYWHSTRAASLIWIPTIFFTGIISWYILKQRRNAQLTVLIFVAGMAVWPALNWIARPGSMENFINFANEDRCRYAYPLSSAAILFWMVIIRPERFIVSYRSVLAFGFILVNLGIQSNNSWLTKRLRPPPLDNKTYWSEFAPQLESSIKTGCPARVIVPAYPERLSLAYYSTKKTDCSAL